MYRKDGFIYRINVYSNGEKNAILYVMESICNLVTGCSILKKGDVLWPQCWSLLLKDLILINSHGQANFGEWNVRHKASAHPSFLSWLLILFIKPLDNNEKLTTTHIIGLPVSLCYWKPPLLWSCFASIHLSNNCLHILLHMERSTHIPLPQIPFSLIFNHALSQFPLTQLATFISSKMYNLCPFGSSAHYIDVSS